MKEIDRVKVERDYFATEAQAERRVERELIDRWQLEVGRHKDAAEDDDLGSEERSLHQEAARVLARCADELALVIAGKR